MTDTWTMHELRLALRNFESELRRAGKSDNTVHTYVDRAERFLRYLSGTTARAAEVMRPCPASVHRLTGED